jgi:hypothetical protein
MTDRHPGRVINVSRSPSACSGGQPIERANYPGGEDASHPSSPWRIDHGEHHEEGEPGPRPLSRTA